MLFVVYLLVGAVAEDAALRRHEEPDGALLETKERQNEADHQSITTRQTANWQPGWDSQQDKTVKQYEKVRFSMPVFKDDFLNIVAEGLTKHGDNAELLDQTAGTVQAADHNVHGEWLSLINAVLDMVADYEDSDNFLQSRSQQELNKMASRVKGTYVNMNHRFAHMNHAIVKGTEQAVSQLKLACGEMEVKNTQSRDTLNLLRKRMKRVKKHYFGREKKTVGDVLRTGITKKRMKMEELVEKTVGAFEDDMHAEGGKSKKSLLEDPAAESPSPFEHDAEAMKIVNKIHAYDPVLDNDNIGMSLADIISPDHKYTSIEEAKTAGMDALGGVLYDPEEEGIPHLSSSNGRLALAKAEFLESELPMKSLASLIQSRRTGKKAMVASKMDEAFFQKDGGGGGEKKTPQPTPNPTPDPDFLWHPDTKAKDADKLVGAEKFPLGSYEASIRSEGQKGKIPKKFDFVPRPHKQKQGMPSTKGISLDQLQDEGYTVLEGQQSELDDTMIALLKGYRKLNKKYRKRKAKDNRLANRAIKKDEDNADLAVETFDATLAQAEEALDKRVAMQDSSFDTQLNDESKKSAEIAKKQKKTLKKEWSDLQTGIGKVESQVTDGYMKVENQDITWQENYKENENEMKAVSKGLQLASTNAMKQLQDGSAQVLEEAGVNFDDANVKLNAYSTAQSVKIANATTAVMAKVNTDSKQTLTNMSAIQDEASDTYASASTDLQHVQMWNNGIKSERRQFKDDMFDFDNQLMKKFESYAREATHSERAVVTKESSAEAELVHQIAMKEADLTESGRIYAKDQNFAHDLVKKKMRAAEDMMDDTRNGEMETLTKDFDLARKKYKDVAERSTDMKKTLGQMIAKLNVAAIPFLRRALNKEDSAVKESKLDARSELDDVSRALGEKERRSFADAAMVVKGKTDLSKAELDKSEKIEETRFKQKADADLTQIDKFVAEKKSELDHFHRVLSNTTRTVEALDGKRSFVGQTLRAVFGRLASELNAVKTKEQMKDQDLGTYVERQARIINKYSKELLRTLSEDEQKQFQDAVNERENEVSKLMEDAGKTYKEKQTALNIIGFQFRDALNQVSQGQLDEKLRMHYIEGNETSLEKLASAVSQGTLEATRTAQQLVESSDAVTDGELDRRAKRYEEGILAQGKGLTVKMQMQVAAVSKGAAAGMKAILADESLTDDERVAKLKKLDQDTRNRIASLTGMVVGNEHSLLAFEKSANANGVMMSKEDKQLAKLLHKETAMRHMQIAKDKTDLSNQAIQLDQYVGKVITALEKFGDQEGVELTAEQKAILGELRGLKAKTAMVAGLRQQEAEQSVLLAAALKKRAEASEDISGEELAAMEAEIAKLSETMKATGRELEKRLIDVDAIKEKALAAVAKFSTSTTHGTLEQTMKLAEILHMAAANSKTRQKNLDDKTESFDVHMQDLVEDLGNSTKKELDSDEQIAHKVGDMIFKDGKFQKFMDEDAKHENDMATRELDKIGGNMAAANDNDNADRLKAEKEVNTFLAGSEKAMNGDAVKEANLVKNSERKTIQQNARYQQDVVKDIDVAVKTEEKDAAKVATDAEERMKMIDLDDAAVFDNAKALQKKIIDANTKINLVEHSSETLEKTRKTHADRMVKEANNRLALLNSHAALQGSLVEEKSKKQNDRAAKLQHQLEDKEKVTHQIEERNKQDRNLLDKLLGFFA